MNPEFKVKVGFHRLSGAVQPYFTALTSFDFDGPEGEYIEDYLHPEWAAMRFAVGPPPLAAVGPGPLKPQWPFVVTGPTCKSVHFGVTRGRLWGLGLQPAGWAKFIDRRACDFADRTLDGSSEAAFALFGPILSIVKQHREDLNATVAAIDAYLMQHAARPVPNEAKLRACHEALNDPDVGHAGQLAERLGVSVRSIERLCARYFGFPPKAVLRRQRFLRSLARFTLNKGVNWSEAIDRQYHDQAQFVRDFRSFMGMTPSQYAEMPHPIIDRTIAQRMLDHGAAPQTDLPTIVRYSGEAEAE